MLFDEVSIGLAQINLHIGNFKANSQKISNYILEAKKSGVELLVFPELTVCGYPPRDFLELDSFIADCELSIQSLAKSCVGIHVLVGAPSKNNTGVGKKLYNSAYLLGEGKILQCFHKTLLPNYDVFDEYRYFESNTEFNVFSLKGHTFGVAICEDIWNTPSYPLYPISPVDVLAKKGAKTIINLSASPFSYEQDKLRKQIISENVKLHGVNLVYCNAIGAQTELIFDGGSLVMNSKGEIIAQAPFFEEKLLIAKDKAGNATQSKIALVHKALILGIKDYFEKLGFEKALVGLSGGIDSALTFALAAEALGSEKVFGVLMPSQFSSDHSIKDAIQLAKNLGAAYEKLPIAPLFNEYQNTLEPIFKNLPFGLAEENLQARIRGTLLMAVSNKHGYILLNTSNKSEAAVGYGTLYGDMCGGLSVLGDVYKTEVFELAKYVNRNQEIIPLNSIVKPPSAELRPNQKDSDSLPEYDELDQILFQYIELSKGKEQISAMGFDTKLVERVLHLVNLNEYKRYQTPPILRVSPKAFGMGRRMPIVAKY